MADINLNDLVTKEGQELDESKTVVERGDAANVTLDNMISAVSDSGILPGQKLTTIKADDVVLDKQSAEDALVEQVALEKLRREREEYNKLADDTKLKDFLYQSEVQRFYREHQFEMSGSQKRSVKREIERNWKKGKFKKWVAEHGDDVLYELNKASNQATGKSPSNTNNAQPVTSLNSLISPIL